jgi:transposase
MYNHFIGVDWSQENMSIARITKEGKKINVIDVPSSVEELQVYLKNLKGKKILTFEETTTAQWLYVELVEYVDKIIVCDPHRNKLLSEGPKTDKIDATKLAKLLKADLLKPVFHTGDEIIYLRKILSGYEDLVKAGVRLKNQRSALFRASGKDKKLDKLEHWTEQFVLDGIAKGIIHYEKEKIRYENVMEKIVKKDKVLKYLTGLPGIGILGALKIGVIVINAKRFPTKGHFLSYCGLIKLKKESGGKSYGKKKSRYTRVLKSVFKTAAVAAIKENSDNFIKDYSLYLQYEKGYSQHNARNAVARRISIISYGIMKTGKKLEIKEEWSEKLKYAA